MSSRRLAAGNIEYYDELPNWQMVEQKKADATKRMRPGIKPKKPDSQLTMEELAVRDRRRKRNKEAAAKKREEFKQTVSILESTKEKLKNENESITTELSQMRTRIAKMNAALREHPCVKINNQQLFPQTPSQDAFFFDLTAGVEEHFEEAIPVEAAPVAATHNQDKISIANDIFDDFLSQSKQPVAPTNCVNQQGYDSQAIFGPEEPTKMLLMNSPPSYEETQQNNYVQQNQTNRFYFPETLTQMDLDVLFSC